MEIWAWRSPLVTPLQRRYPPSGAPAPRRSPSRPGVALPTDTFGKAPESWRTHRSRIGSNVPVAGATRDRRRVGCVRRAAIKREFVTQPSRAVTHQAAKPRRHGALRPAQVSGFGGFNRRWRRFGVCRLCLGGANGTLRVARVLLAPRLSRLDCGPKPVGSCTPDRNVWKSARVMAHPQVWGWLKRSGRGCNPRPAQKDHPAR